MDGCVEYAKTHDLFLPEEMACAKTLYNAVWNGTIDFTPTELPKSLKRKKIKKKGKASKKNYGKSIEERPDTASQGTKFGHWDGDTVTGIHNGTGSVEVALVENLTRESTAVLIPGKTSEAGMGGVRTWQDYFGKSCFPSFLKRLPQRKVRNSVIFPKLKHAPVFCPGLPHSGDFRALLPPLVLRTIKARFSLEKRNTESGFLPSLLPAPVLCHFIPAVRAMQRFLFFPFS